MSVCGYCCTVFLVLQVFGGAFCYKPVIIIHGILNGASDLDGLKDFIQTAHPGTEVHLIDLFDYYDSLQPIWLQVNSIRNATAHIIKAAKNGVHMLGYSQGGLIARGIIQTTDFHNVDSFIALSSPLSGQYGDTDVFDRLFPHILKGQLYKVFYTAYGQRWSIGNYWKDPHEISLYQKYSDFLAQLNNEARPERSTFKDSWKTNFIRLKKLVLIGGPDDGVITPWQSAQFGYYNEQEHVLPMQDMKLYKDDAFGLRTLDESNSIIRCTFMGISHLQWHRSQAVFDKCVAPHLT